MTDVIGDRPEEGVVSGDLRLRGSGDPTVLEADYDQLATDRADSLGLTYRAVLTRTATAGPAPSTLRTDRSAGRMPCSRMNPPEQGRSARSRGTLDG